MTDAIAVALISGGVTITGSVLTFVLTIKQMQNKTEKAHEEQLSKLRKDLTEKLEEHRKEYLKGIDEVQDNIQEIKVEYSKTVTRIETQIEALSDRVEKHNNVIERTYQLESKVGVIDEKVKVANNRIKDLEDDRK